MWKKYISYCYAFDPTKDDIFALVRQAGGMGITVRPNFRNQADGKKPYIAMQLPRETMASCLNHHEVFATAVRQLWYIYQNTKKEVYLKKLRLLYKIWTHDIGVAYKCYYALQNIICDHGLVVFLDRQQRIQVLELIALLGNFEFDHRIKSARKNLEDGMRSFYESSETEFPLKKLKAAMHDLESYLIWLHLRENRSSGSLDSRERQSFTGVA